jgi:hypothetical protein
LNLFNPGVFIKLPRTKNTAELLSQTLKKIKLFITPKSRSRIRSLRAKRSNLAFSNEIATPACRNVTSVCRHAPFPAFSGTRNDRPRKGFPFLNRDLGHTLPQSSGFFFYPLKQFSRFDQSVDLLDILTESSIALDRWNLPPDNAVSLLDPYSGLEGKKKF